MHENIFNTYRIKTERDIQFGLSVSFSRAYMYMIYMYVKMLSNRNTHSQKQTSPSIQTYTSIDRLRTSRNKQRLWWVTNRKHSLHKYTHSWTDIQKENRSEQPRWVRVSKWQDIIFPCICTIFIYLSLAWPHGSQHHTTQSHGNYTRHSERASGRTSATVYSAGTHYVPYHIVVFRRRHRCRVAAAKRRRRPTAAHLHLIVVRST